MHAKPICVSLLALAVCLPQAFADPSKLAPRVPVDKGRYPGLPETTVLQHLVVKFQEGTAVRLRGGLLAVKNRDERDRRDLQTRGLEPSAVDNDVAEVRRLVALAPRIRGIRRLFSLDEGALAERRANGEARSGRQLADLDLYYELPVTPGTTAMEVAELLDALNALKSIEIAYAQPPAHPASLGSSPLADEAAPPSPTPNFQSQQGYLNAAPQGIDALYAWTQPGGLGQGIKIVDIEGGWRTTHEDLPVLFHAGGIQINDLVWRNHGTAVLGELVGKNNGFGVTGIVHQAQAGYESIGSQNLPSALVNAGNAVGDGVVLIELHYGGPTSSSPCTCNQSQCYFVPAEYFQSHFDAIANLTANGTVVVEAAGNGSTNLDDPVYGTIFQRAVRDSGAILVAASNSFDRNPTCWTNWGSRIDLHGWGGSVTTLGYGDLFNENGEDRWYTAFFAGTSSASPIVTGAAVSVQGHALATRPSVLDPLVVRDLLKNTGTPHTSATKNIGRLPDLRAAFAALDGTPPPTCYALTRTHTGSGGDPAAAPESSPGCPAGQYTGGASISLTASPAANWTVAGWSGTSDNTSTSTLNSLTMPAGPHTVSVHYVTVPDIPLSNNVPRSDSLTSDIPQGAWRYYYADLEAGSSQLVVDLFGLTGDVDLYVRFNAKPTVTEYDCRPYFGGASSEQCAFPSPSAGRWWIGVANFPAGTFNYTVRAAWSIPTPPALDFYTVPPCRVADTRSGSPLSSGVPAMFPIAGTCGVPASAKAVALNVTVVSATGSGNVALWPANLSKPPTSVINFVAGQSRANNGVLGLATDGSGVLAAQGTVANAGTLHLILDVTGYFK